VKLGHQSKFSLVGIDGKDIYDGKDIPNKGQHVPTLGKSITKPEIAIRRYASRTYRAYRPC